MDGKFLIRAVLQNVDGDSDAARSYKIRRLYECLDRAAGIFCRLTRIVKNSATIATVAGQRDYPLPPDFLGFYMERGPRGGYFVRYCDTAGNYSWPRVVDYGTLFRLNLTDRQEIPLRAALRPIETAAVPVTGTATSAGASVHGVAVLTDTAKAFNGANRVWPRDIIHNETDGSDGYVVEVVGATQIKCCLFDGKNNDFSNSDAYTIIPRAERQLTLEAPADVADHQIVIPYVGMPSPVFAEYLSWRLPERTCEGIAAGAAALWQLPENSVEEARIMNGQFVDEIRRIRDEKGTENLKTQRRPAGSGW